MLPKVIAEGRFEGGLGMFERYEIPGYTKDQLSCGFPREKLCRRKKQRHTKEKSHKQQEIFKTSEVDSQLCDFSDKKTIYRRMRRKHKKRNSLKLQQEIFKISNCRGKLVRKLVRILVRKLWLPCFVGCVLIVISILAALWMA
jgi:hypothetical protein